MIFETADEHVCRKVPRAPPGATAGEIRKGLASQAFDCVTDVAVCEGSSLRGLLIIEKLLSAPEGALAGDLMDPDPPVVSPGTDQEVAAWKAVQHGESSLAVVDADGTFLGLVPPRRLLSVLLQEHHEDMARLSGVSKDALSAKTSLLEPVKRRLLHRLPWLLVGLAGAFLAAELVSSFEHALQANLILAFFLPGIIYLADAVGTQTETLIVRGLSVGIPISTVVRRELITGVLIGVVLAAVIFPVALWRWGNPDVATVLASSLMVACSIATLVAIVLPWLLKRMGTDPAFGSGPLATVIQDLLSILVFLLFARWILPG